MIALALQVAAAFNLVCTGTYRTGPIAISTLDLPGTPFTTVYRIDLSRGRFCTNECPSTSALARVTETEITLYDVHTDPGTANGTTTNINRETGAYMSTSIFGDSMSVFTAQCERAPFTGFPTRRF